MEYDNIKMIEEITHIPVIALIRDGDSNIDIDVHMLAGLYGKDGN